MPRINPTQVVEFIDKSWPVLAEGGVLGTLDAGHYQPVATLVSMIDSLDEAVFGGFPAAAAGS